MAVTMMRIRPMAVNMFDPLMDVFVAMGFLGGSVVGVKMVEVRMAVGMGVRDPFVPVRMDVPLPDDQGDGQGHQRPGRRHRPADGVPQKDERDERPGKRPEAEKSARPERPQALEGAYEQNQVPTPRGRALPSPDSRVDWAFVPTTLPELEAPQRVLVRVSSRSHYLTDVRPDADNRGAPMSPGCCP